MTDAFLTTVTVGRVLFCLAVVGVCLPAAALGSDHRRLMTSEVNAGLVWAWLAIAVVTPLIASVRGVNWLTALVVAAVGPVGLWVWRHRGGCRRAFITRVHSIVCDTILPRRLRRPPAAAYLATLPLLALVLIGPEGADLRPTGAVDFDTMTRAHQLESGTGVVDPLAAMVVVLGRLSAADMTSVGAGVRLGLVALTAAAVFVALGRRWTAVAASAAVVALAPLAATAACAIALVAVTGLTSVTAWLRDRQSRYGWHAAASALLIVGLLVPFSPDVLVLVRAPSGAQYLEYPEAARRTRALVRTEGDVDWMLVAPPEQRFALDRDGRFYDLATFVPRFEGRTASPAFRFDLPVDRLFVLVEKRAFDGGATPVGVQFVANQAAAYSVPRRRADLQSRARILCDDYLRTHAGAVTVYEDNDILLYRFDR